MESHTLQARGQGQTSSPSTRQYSTFNARIRDGRISPTFQESWRSQRCLVVSTAYRMGGREEAPKSLNLFAQRSDSIRDGGSGESMARHGGGEELWSCTVIVKDADEMDSQFPRRMAVLLARIL